MGGLFSETKPVEQPVTPSRRSGSSSSNEESEWTISERIRKRSLLTQHYDRRQTRLRILQQLQARLPILQLLQKQLRIHRKDPDENPMKHSSSFEFLPPNTELRVVLLGSSWSERSSVGNFILGETKFITEEEPDLCLRVRGELKEKEIVLINTPDLLHPHISEDKLREHVETCESLSDPGPHVFLLVLQPEDFTEELFSEALQSPGTLQSPD